MKRHSFYTDAGASVESPILQSNSWHCYRSRSIPDNSVLHRWHSRIEVSTTKVILPIRLFSLCALSYYEIYVYVDRKCERLIKSLGTCSEGFITDSPSSERELYLSSRKRRVLRLKGFTFMAQPAQQTPNAY